MGESGFNIASREWAKREFPKRLTKIAMKKHHYSPGDTFGINQDIANACGVDKSMVTRWLKGALPRASTILRIAEAYGVSPDYLVGNDDAPEGNFSINDLQAEMPYEAIQNVMRIMYEAQEDLPNKPSNEEFAQAAVEVLRLVSSEPNAPEYAIYGAAVRSLKHGPSAVSGKEDTASN